MPVAHAWEEELGWSELRRMIPLDAIPEDSAALAQDIINNWLRKQVMVHHAELNLTGQELDFEDRLRDYRNSLVIYAFENAMVREKLDTIVRDAEIERYYQEHPQDFALKQDILRASWFRVPEEDRSTLRKLERWFRSGNADDQHELEVWLAERGVPIADDGRTWMTHAALARDVPVGELTMDGPGRWVLQDSSGSWFLQVIDLRPVDTASPLELVTQDIRAIVLNQRKLALLARMREDLYAEAWKAGVIGTP